MPVLYPYGKGSWYPGADLTISDFCKKRLLDIDPRWRMHGFWVFVMLDRLIKTRIIAMNHSRVMNTSKLSEKVSVSMMIENNKKIS